MLLAIHVGDAAVRLISLRFWARGCNDGWVACGTSNCSPVHNLTRHGCFFVLLLASQQRRVASLVQAALLAQ